MNITNISSKNAWQFMEENITATLIDVRTNREWQEVGKPQLLQNSKNKLLLLSWKILPEMSINKNFIKDLERNIVDKETPLLFICRSGIRSFEAATSAYMAGFLKCFNIADGFEGSNFGLGWKLSNLPWEIKNVS